jgi:hypothetical protein
MKVVILYRPNSEHGSAVDTFVHEYQRRHEPGRIEVVNVDTRDGSATASLYDIMQYPAILALSNDGSLLKSWEGEMLPLMDEISYYAYT